MPIGDDILGCFEGAVAFYLDDFDMRVGERISSIFQALKQVVFIYRYWSGRMTGYMVGCLGKIMPRFLQAVITAALYSANIFLALQIVYKSTEKAICSPISFIILFLALCWFKPNLFYTYMWTMISVYAVPVFLCLFYYKWSVSDEELGKSHNRWLLQGLGFLAGFSHEVLSLCMIIAVGISWLKAMCQRKQIWKDSFRHTGFIVGYLLCFFAPGNFYRMKQSHDVITASLKRRLFNSIKAHITVLIGTREAKVLFVITLLIVCAAVVILMIKKDKEMLKKLCLENIEFIISGASSILIWSFFPRVPTYGLVLWLFIVYIVLLRVIWEVSGRWNVAASYRPRILQEGIAIALLALFAIYYRNEISSYIEVAVERDRLVTEAVAHGDDEVVVPKVPEDLPTQRYMLDYLNGQEQYDTDYYCRYYGVHIIIEE